MVFDFSKKYILENSRVALKPLEKNHVDDLMMINSAELWAYTYIPGYPKELLADYIDIALKKRQQENSYPFIVFDKQKNQYAGSTRFYDIDFTHQTLKIGFTWYGTSFQGSGINKNCKFLLLRFAFEQLGIERVEFYTDANNKRSIAAMKSIGCTEEGVLRSNFNMGEGKKEEAA